MSKNLENLGKKVKEKREMLGYSQQKLADLMGYTSRSTITKIEKGERDLPLDKLKLLAKVLKTTPEYLVGWNSLETKKDPYYVDTSMLTETQKAELNTIINMNVSMFNSSRELSEHDRKMVIKVLTEAFINTLPNKK